MNLSKNDNNLIVTTKQAKIYSSKKQPIKIRKSKNNIVTSSEDNSKTSCNNLDLLNSPRLLKYYNETSPERRTVQTLSDEGQQKYLELKRELKYLLSYDQLKRQMFTKKAFYGFFEGDIEFMPSFKYDKESDCFDSSGKSRTPAWTDRILFTSYNLIKSGQSKVDRDDGSDNKDNSNKVDNYPILSIQDYNCVDSRHSDHRPVFATFKLTFPKS